MRAPVLKSWAISRTRRWNGSLRMSSSVLHEDRGSAAGGQSAAKQGGGAGAQPPVATGIPPAVSAQDRAPRRAISGLQRCAGGWPRLEPAGRHAKVTLPSNPAAVAAPRPAWQHKRVAEVPPLLILADLAESDSSGPVAVRLLDAAARRRGLARRLGGELLARGLATGALACGLLGAGHRGVLVGGRGWQYVLLGDDVLDERRS